ncbi:insulinase family protein [Chlamydia avium]|uniref:Protease 3 n=1 Tax=Chlamydia avium 10DC88 TaxID=1229831 RepID=W8JRG1_9CHLA|nr:insulinase family protein [Chlamydia avium]AHK63443.1 Peptidase M16 inactive domain protein [Chlamydia avium 10DC88]
MKWKTWSANILLISLFLTSCYPKTIPDQCPLKILTPSLAHQKIAKVLCPNGLQLLIISNPESPISGAALAVKTGNSSDPKEFPGLAHLTEHCVFLGNQKYPSPDSFSQFLSNNNGKYNAFTSSHSTSYLFSVDNSVFHEAIDQFVHLFIDPLFLQESLDKEKNAVHQEFAIHPTKDNRRIFRIQQLIAPKNSPINHFGCGNATTLAKVSPQDMRTWFQQYYHADNMIAIVHTSEPLNKTIKFLTKLFAKIPKQKHRGIQPSRPIIEDNSSSGKLYINTAVEPTTRLHVYWNFHNTAESFPLGCFASIAYILNHEGPNSLISVLKKEKLITQAASGFYRTSQDTGEFTIEYQLTDEGEKNYSDILMKTFAYLHYIQEQSIPNHCLNDISTMNALDYCYSSNTELFKTLYTQISTLIHEDLSTYPYQTLVYPKYSSEEEKAILNTLSDPYRARYILSTKHLEYFPSAVQHHDAIFNMSYYEQPLLNLEGYKQAPPYSSLSLPQKNIYIPKDIEIVKTTAPVHGQFPFSPDLAYKGPGLTLYYCEDQFYTLPKLAIDLCIRSPEISIKNLRSLIMTDIYSLAIDDILTHEYYSATQAGLTFSSSLHGEGLGLSISGYDTTVPILLKSILSSLQLTLSQEQFSIYKQQLLENYQKKIISCPIRTGIQTLWTHSLQNVYAYDEKIAVLQTINFEEMQYFAENLLNQVFIEGMILGPPKKCKQELTDILKDFISSHIPYEASPFYYQRQEKNSENIQTSYPLSGNAILLVLQDELSSSIEHLAATEMMFSWLHHTIFMHLRTEQQLGYVVGACYQEALLLPAGIFYIRSDAYSPGELVEKTRDFIQKVAHSPETYGMSPQYFSDLRSAYIKNLIHPSESLETMNSILFSLAFDKPSIQFSRNNDKISAAQNMDYVTFKDYCQEFLNEKLGKHISIYVHGATSISVCSPKETIDKSGDILENPKSH